MTSAWHKYEYKTSLEHSFALCISNARKGHKVWYIQWSSEWQPFQTILQISTYPPPAWQAEVTSSSGIAANSQRVSIGSEAAGWQSSTVGNQHYATYRQSCKMLQFRHLTFVEGFLQRIFNEHSRQCKKYKCSMPACWAGQLLQPM